MAYEGYLIAFGGYILPNSYLIQKGYSTTPNQRTELSATRDNNNYLCRVTSPNHKTTIKLTTGVLHLSDKLAIQSIMAKGLVNEVERKYSVTYYNDETDSYSTGFFYMPDVTYPVIDTLGNDIIYSSISFELIEY
jgi:hypothetical protein